MRLYVALSIKSGNAMPLHDYICKKCSYKFEVLIAGESYQSGDDVDGHVSVIIRCPECGSPNTVKQAPLIANTPAKWGDAGASGSLAS